MSDQGVLIAIGGHEDKEGERTILKEVVRRMRGDILVLATVASQEPAEYVEAYEKAFADLGVKTLRELYVNERAEASHGDLLSVFDDAAGVFFTGGDQLRISSQIGDTPVETKVRELLARGGVVAGTSAGASMMSETMLVRGPSQESYRLGDLHMAPGLGLVRDMIIDQHFAERGRIGRLLGAVAHNPRVLGVGIDEDTAAVIENEAIAVLGAGAVYVVDGEAVTHSNVAEGASDKALSMHDVRLHVLSAGDRFDLRRRRALAAGPRGRDDE
ncbi:MAG TPA: cyanophycinase [Phenylobacterium sp.]|nr:cyanophycinase [Phenylobacterium sp.]